jgi:hypothetical protein
MDLLKRIIKIVRAEAESLLLGERPTSRNSPRQEAEYDRADDRPPSTPQYPQQFIEDLAVFNLSPPSSLSEVKRVRNQEMKKYHADRFFNDPERYQTSQEIMQIYNTAYERLKAYYAKSSDSSN